MTSKPIEPLPETKTSEAKIADFGVKFSGHKNTLFDLIFQFRHITLFFKKMSTRVWFD